MAPLAFAAGIDGVTARRLAAALALSLGAHVALILAVRAGGPRAPAQVPATIQARIVAAPASEIRSAQQAANGETRPREPDAARLTAERGEVERPAPGVERGQAHAATREHARPARAPSAPAVSEHAQPDRAEPAPAAARPAPRAAAEVPLAPDETYYAIAALDRPPMPLSPPDPCYPHGASGEVVYELMIDEAGAVTRAAVLSVQPSGLFTAAAVELCSRLKFSPALKQGRAVRSRVRFVVGLG